MALAGLTDPQAVLAAVHEYDVLGAKAFLKSHRFGLARQYYLQLHGRLYDAKAVAGVAYGLQHPEEGIRRNFSGGESGSNVALRRLGFTVLDGRPRTTDAARTWRLAVWQHHRSVLDAKGADGLLWWNIPPDFGDVGEAKGVWIDNRVSRSVEDSVIAIGIHHNGALFQGDSDEDEALYLYPRGSFSGDESRVSALKAAADLKLPILIYCDLSCRDENDGQTIESDLRLGWIEGWDDRSRTFLISSSDAPPIDLLKADRSEDEIFRLKGNRSARTPGLIRRRPGQRRFKFQVLQRYGMRCPFSGITVPAMLEAAHLVGDADGGTDDPRNGILLNAALHRAFDAHLFAINPDTLKVETLPEGPGLADLGIVHPSLDGLMKLPHQEALKWRYERWKETY